MDIAYYKSKYEPIDGKWFISKELGRGAFGTVFEVERRDFTNTKSAMKIISIPSSKNEVESFKEDNYDMDENSISSYFYGFVEEFVKEFQLMSKLRGHSNIVSYEDHDVVKREEGIGWDIFIRMELLTPMNKYFASNTPKQSDVIKLGIDICKALEVCQRYKIIHRDIKPSNIFVSETGDFKLGDFGVARTLEKTSSGLSKKGTYIYMAPEVYKGAEYGSNVDIYSLGIVMYKMLNNNLEPFRNSRTHSDEENALSLRIKGEVSIPKPANADGRLAEIVLKACSFNPKDRYESPLQMREELENILYTESEGKVIYPNGDELSYEPSTAGKNIDSVSETEKTAGIFDSIDIQQKHIDDKSIETEEFENKAENTSSDETIGIFGNKELNDKKSERNTKEENKEKNNKKPLGIIAFVSAAILIVVCIVLFGGKSIRDIENIPEEIVLAFDEHLQLEPVIVPQKAKSEIKYTMEDTDIAMVDENGLIVAKSYGSTGGFTTLFIKAGNIEKEVSIRVTEPINASMLEEKYKKAKEYLEVVNSDTTINQDNVAIEKLGIQQTLDSLENYGISVDDISEQTLDILVELFNEKYVQGQIDKLQIAYEKAKNIESSSNNNNTNGNSKNNTTTPKKCSVCGSTAHTSHPTCSVCGSTSHTSHPTCPVCGSTSHTSHPIELPKNNNQAPPSIQYYD